MDSMENVIFPVVRQSRVEKRQLFALSLPPSRFTLHLAEGKPFTIHSAEGKHL